MPLLDPFGPAAGLDVSAPVAGLDPFAPDPNAPGPFKKGVISGGYGLKGIAGGDVQAAGRAIGVPAVEAYGADVVKNAGEAAAPYQMKVEDVNSVGSAIDFAKYTVGNQLPILAATIAGGVLGRGAGALSARGAAAAEAAAIKQTAETVGLGASSVAMEAGQIFPEAVKTGVENPLTRTAAGSLAAGALDTVLPALFFRRIRGLLGGAEDKAANAARAPGFGAVAKEVGTTAAKAGAFEGVTEGAQSYIENLAAGKPLSGKEFDSDLLNSAVMGAIMGTLTGGLIGGATAMNRPVQVPLTEPMEQSAGNQPVPPGVSGVPDQRPPIAIESEGKPPLGLVPTTTKAEDLWAAHNQLETEHFAATRTAKDAQVKLDALKDAPKVDKRAIAIARKELRTATGLQDKLGERLATARTAAEAQTTLENKPESGTIIPKVGGDVLPPTLPVPKRTAESVLHDVQQARVDAQKPLVFENWWAQHEAEKNLRVQSGEAAVEETPTQIASAFQAAQAVQAQKAAQVATRQAAVEQARQETEQRAAAQAAKPQVAELRTLQKLNDRETLTPAEQSTAVARGWAKPEGGLTREGHVARKALLRQAETDSTQVQASIASESAAMEDAIKSAVLMSDAKLSGARGMTPERQAKRKSATIIAVHDAVKRAYQPAPGATTVPTQPEVLARLKTELKNIPGFNQQQSAEVAESIMKAVQQGPLFSKAAGAVPIDPDSYYLVNADTDDIAGGPYKTVREAKEAQGANTQDKIVKGTQVPAQNSNAALSPDITSEEFALLPQEDKNLLVDRRNQILAQRGQAMIAELTKLIGSDPHLAVNVMEATEGSPVGSYTRVGPLKSLVTMALNAKDGGLSIASHEGFHYAEDQILDGRERQVITNGLKNGSPLFNRLVEVSRQYDRENGTNITDEIVSIPAEAHAYGFQFWRAGKLQTEGLIAGIFQKLRAFFERVANLIAGHGFTSIEDVFDAFAQGQYAERARNSESALFVNGAAVDPSVLGLASTAGAQGIWRSALFDQVKLLNMKQGSAQGWRDQIKGLVSSGRVKQAEIDAVGLDDWLTLRAEPQPVYENGFGIVEQFRQDDGTWKQVDDLGIYAQKESDLNVKITPRMRTAVRQAAMDYHTVGRIVIKPFEGLDFGKRTNGKITKDEVTAFLAENGVKVEETQLGGESNAAYTVFSGITDEQLQQFNTREEANDWARTVGNNAYVEMTAEDGSMPTKFSQYQLPGGKNYRELLLTLPKTDHEQTAEEQKIFGRGNAHMRVADPIFISSHFDTPNILAHIRFNERTDADGKRVLFLEEIQSDWAQKGKKEGFIDPNIQKRIDALDKERQAIEDDRLLNNLQDTDAPPKVIARWTEIKHEIRKLESQRNNGVPSAPFVNKTEAWVALSLKRMIRYAAENGFDRVAWTTGEQQVSRYAQSLRHAVDRIEWEKTEGGVHIVGFKGGGRHRGVDGDVMDDARGAIRRADNLGFDTTVQAWEAIKGHADWETRWPDYNSLEDRDLVRTARAMWVASRAPATKVVDTKEKESNLSDAIGKSMADKIKNDPEQKGVIEGDDITISDTGMAGFYDKIVPSVANEVLRKLGGGKVGEVRVTNPDETVITPADSARMRALNGLSNRPADLQRELDVLNRRQSNIKGIAQPGFDITPEMVERTLDGIPLFSRGAVADAGFTPAQSQQAATDMARQFKNGELELMQTYKVVGEMYDRATARPAPYPLMAKGIASRVATSVSHALDQIHTAHYLARFSKGFKNVITPLSVQESYKTMLIEKGSKLGLSTWHAAAQTDRDVVWDALLKRRVEGFLEGSPEYITLRASLSSPVRMAMFDQVTGSKGLIAEFLDRQFTAESQRNITLMDAATFQKWGKERAEDIKNLVANGYVPFDRYGDFTVRLTVADAKGNQQTVGYYQFESKGEAVVRAKQLEQEFAGTGVRVSDVGDRYKAEHDNEISISQVLDIMRRQGIALEQNEREKLARALLAADSQRRQRMMRAKLVPGYSREGWQVLHKFITGMSGQIAHAEFSQTVNDALDGKPVEARIVYDKKDEDGNLVAPFAELKTLTTQDAEGKDTTRNLWVEDGPQGGHYRNLADQRASLVMNPASDSVWSTRLKGMAVAYFLGGSISAGAVQIMSVPMVTLPYLAQFTKDGYVGAMSHTLAASTLAAKNFVVLRSLERLSAKDDNGNYLERIEGISNELRAALITATQDGTLSSTEVHQIMGISRGGVLAQSKRVQKAMDTWMYPFKLGEGMSRIISFMAAYKIGTENALTGTALYDFAREAVDGTQNRFDPVNRPALAFHPLWSMMLMFKTFPLFITEVISTMYQQGAAGKKAAAFMLLGMVAMAGVQGLPFAEDIMDLVDVISQKLFGSNFNVRRVMRNVLKDASEALIGVDKSNMIMRGIVNDLTTLNVATRVGNGDIIPGTRVGAADTDYGRALEQILGAPVSMAVGVGGQIDNLTGSIVKGDFDGFMAALRAGGPVAVRNAVKGYEQLDAGYAQDARGRKLVDVSGVHALFQMLGLTSSAVTKAYDDDAIDRQTSAFYKQAQGEFTQAMVKALKEGNSEKAQEISTAMQRFTEANPEMPINLSPATLRRDIMLAGMPLNARTLKLLPRNLRGTSVAAEGIAAAP